MISAGCKFQLGDHLVTQMCDKSAHRIFPLLQLVLIGGWSVESAIVDRLLWTRVETFVRVLDLRHPIISSLKIRRNVQAKIVNFARLTYCINGDVGVRMKRPGFTTPCNNIKTRWICQSKDAITKWKGKVKVWDRVGWTWTSHAVGRTKLCDSWRTKAIYLLRLMLWSTDYGNGFRQH